MSCNFQVLGLWIVFIFLFFVFRSPPHTFIVNLFLMLIVIHPLHLLIASPEGQSQASFLTLRHGSCWFVWTSLERSTCSNGWWHLHRQECSLFQGLNFWFSWTLGLSLFSQKGTPSYHLSTHLTQKFPSKFVRLWIYFHIHLFSRFPWWNSFKISLEGFPLRKRKCPLGWAGWREGMMTAGDSCRQSDLYSAIRVWQKRWIRFL